jgi:Endosomal/lysosomal potassium channel TMEM175
MANGRWQSLLGFPISYLPFPIQDAPDSPAFSALWPLWPTVISHAVSYLFIAIIWINHHYLMRFVGTATLGLIWANLVHLFYGVALALRNGMGCAHHTRVAACRVLRSAVRVRRHCLQRIRAPHIGPSRHHPRVRAYAADGEAPITGCPCDPHHGDARCVRQAASRLRSDMWCPDPAFAARGSWQSAVTVLLGTHAGACEKTASTSKSRRAQILTNR